MVSFRVSSSSTSSALQFGCRLFAASALQFGWRLFAASALQFGCRLFAASALQFGCRLFAARQFDYRRRASSQFAVHVLAAALLFPAWLPGGSSSSAAWLWPVPPPHSVTRPFAAPASAYAAGHRGIDLSARPGAPVFASAGGVVSFSGVVAGRPVLSVSHPGDLVSSVEPVLGVVFEGDRVVAGQLVGRLASGGHCANECLHFGVRLHGQYVSPMLLLGGIPRAVLLPLSHSHSHSHSRENAVVRAKTRSERAQLRFRGEGKGQARGWAVR